MERNLSSPGLVYVPRDPWRRDCAQRRKERFEPFSQRFTGTFSEDGNTITGRWEIAEDGADFTTDFDLIYRRVASRGWPAGRSVVP
jgi:hypothetical protein